MASVIWKTSHDQMPTKKLWRDIPCFKHNSNTWIIAKGNIIEGIEAKE